MWTKSECRNGLIKAGVRNLREFGYPFVNENNILTDAVYRAFFLRMLKDKQNITKHDDIESARQNLIEEMEKGQLEIHSEGTVKPPHARSQADSKK